MSAAKALDWLADVMAGQPAMMTAADALGVLRCSKRQLYRLVADGRIHALRATEAGSSRLLIPRVSLEKYLRTLDGSAA